MHHLLQAEDTAQSMGVTIRNIRYSLLREGHDPSIIRYKVQKCAYDWLLNKESYCLLTRLRTRLHRWPFPDPEGWVASRAKHRILIIHKLLPPRVAHVLFSSYFNRWCTKQRFQVRGARCPLCNDFRDALEHICRLLTREKLWDEVLRACLFSRLPPHGCLRLGSQPFGRSFGPAHYEPLCRVYCLQPY